ncbi:hypothetical protein HAX54_028864 [Datura stramonium]|uniref:Uncharacterized protein n=1 Tax=Datura stramonium TaxID=4076 RepID=A0ABS8V756_DATST|nr:hypothetical protein [Datura stramonium]
MATYSKKRGNVAKIKVEIDLLKPRLDQIWIGFNRLEGGEDDKDQEDDFTTVKRKGNKTNKGNYETGSSSKIEKGAHSDQGNKLEKGTTIENRDKSKQPGVEYNQSKESQAQKQVQQQKNKEKAKQNNTKTQNRPKNKSIKEKDNDSEHEDGADSNKDYSPNSGQGSSTYEDEYEILEEGTIESDEAAENLVKSSNGQKDDDHNVN